MNIILVAFIAYLLVMSLVTFIMYKVDKSRAIKKQWRIKESVLLMCSFIGGAFGATIAMYQIRHKNRKWYFVATNFLSLMLHIALIVAIVVLL